MAAGLMQDVPSNLRISDIEQSESNSGLLGIGSFADVRLGNWHGTEVAIKRLYRNWIRGVDGGLTKTYRQFLEEGRCLYGIRHPNIVQVYGICYPSHDLQSPGIVKERMFLTLKERYSMATPLGEVGERRVASGVTAGLQHLHSLQIVHRDLKTPNVMLTSASPTECTAKITDIGSAMQLEHDSDEQSMTAEPGNRRYMARETWNVSTRSGNVRTRNFEDKSVYGKPADIYSLGVLLLAMSARREPPDIIVIQEEGRQRDLAAIGDQHHLLPVIMSCLQEDRTLRPNACDLAGQLAEEKKKDDAMRQPPRISTESLHNCPQLQVANRKLAERDEDVARLREQLSSLQCGGCGMEATSTILTDDECRQIKESGVWATLPGPTSNADYHSYGERHNSFLFVALNTPPRLFRTKDARTWEHLPNAVPKHARLLTSLSSNGADLFVVVHPEFSETGEHPHQLYRWHEATLLLQAVNNHRAPMLQKFCKAVATRDTVYFFGGINSKTVASHVVTAYDLRTHEWTVSPLDNLPDLPHNRRCLQAVHVGDDIVLGGGYKPDSETPPDSYPTLVFGTNPQSRRREWLTDRHQGIPPVHCRSGLCLAQGYLLQAGGDGRISTCKAHRLHPLDFQPPTPITLPQLPKATQSLSVIEFRGTFLGVGGFHGYRGWNSSVFALPVAACTWT